MIKTMVEVRVNKIYGLCISQDKNLNSTTFSFNYGKYS